MRIEIILGQDGSRSYYQITRHELIIGSSQQCDLVLPNPEISRRHLSLLQRGDRYFVIDHSSTNGTFIEDEKLEAGKKIEWKVNTPMRLANEVILTLVEDVSGDDSIYRTQLNDENRQDKTMVIPLAKLKASVKKPQPSPRKKKKQKQGMGKAILLVAAILGLAYYLNVEKDVRIKRRPKTIPDPAENSVETPAGELSGEIIIPQ